MPTRTPWGPAQHSHPYARGIIGYSTAGHGGYHVSKTRMASLKAPFDVLLAPWKTRKGDAWFEEDSDWSLVVAAFADLFDERKREVAEETLRNWHPDVWEALHGRALAPEESVIRAEQHFYATHKDDYIGIAGWGSWAAHVPEGMVGVCAVKGGRSNYKDGCEETHWLVPKAEYDTRSRFGFVIDPARHQKSEHAFGASKQVQAVTA